MKQIRLHTIGTTAHGHPAAYRPLHQNVFIDPLFALDTLIEFESGPVQMQEIF